MQQEILLAGVVFLAAVALFFAFRLLEEGSKSKG